MKTKKEKQKQHKLSNRNWYLENKEKVKKSNKAWRANNVAKYMVLKAKRGAVLRKCKFDLTEEDLLPLPKLCPILGIRLRRTKCWGDPNGYSLDRVNNKKGYTKDNVIVMSFKANKLKSDGALKVFKAIVKLMEEYENRSMEASTKRI